jgi:LmbE family N-acetylglucosaminyl deacetylase
MADILIVAAHPDDEVLGCGGTVLRQIEDGADVACLVLGDGVTSRYDEDEDASDELENRNEAFDAACEAIEFSASYLHALPDNRFDSIPLLDVVKIIEGVVNEERPTTVYTHFVGDLNIDHRITFEAVLTACRPKIDCSVKEIYSFEVPSATDWAASALTPFTPNYFVDISEVLDRKKDIMSIYDTETPVYPHPRSLQALEANARRWGSVVGVPAAEAFMLIRSVI